MSGLEFSSIRRAHAPSLLVRAVGILAAGVICGGSVRWLTFPDRPPFVVPDARAPLREIELRTAKVAPAHAESFSTRLDELTILANPTKRARAISGIADDLDVAAIREALAALANQSVRDAEEIRLQLLARWSELEPEAALEYAAALPGGFEAPGAITAVIESWAQIDPDGAEAGVNGMHEGFAKKIARTALLPVISEGDPTHAFALYRQGTPYYSDEISNLFQNWTELQPEEAAAQAAQLPAAWQRGYALHDVMEKWAKTDREAALEWATSWQPPSPPGVTIERRDPGPLSIILQSWMGEEPAAALEWLKQMPEDTAKSDLLAALSSSVSGNDPQHAVEIAAMMSEGKAQDTTLRRLIGQWAGSDFPSALAWAQQQPDDGVRQILLPALVSNLAERDTPAALELALSLEGDAGTGSVEMVLDAWSGRDPAAAAEWVATQPENADYLARIAFRWAGKDQAAALDWASTLPPGSEKDAALASGVRMVAQTDQPRAAVEWIALIDSPEKRAATYQEMAFWWLRSDPKKAREWIDDSPLSRKARAELLGSKSK
ncbi:MAG: hypothetical protein ABI680_08775 [Chthoniobacteraceae bacterium]